MRIKNALVGILFLLFPIISPSQIKIDDVGDGWKGEVESALSLIEKYDPEVYEQVLEYCNHISFWLGHHSTTQYPSSIIISAGDMKIGSINNLACIIVHETVHLKMHIKGETISSNQEELIAYLFEWEFANKIPNIEPWILNHIDRFVKLYAEMIENE